WAGNSRRRNHRDPACEGHQCLTSTLHSHSSHSFRITLKSIPNRSDAIPRALGSGRMRQGNEKKQTHRAVAPGVLAGQITWIGDTGTQILDLSLLFFHDLSPAQVAVREVSYRHYPPTIGGCKENLNTVCSCFPL